MTQEDRRQRPPTTSELNERLARVEEGQDHVVEKIDELGEQLDEELGPTQERTRRMWFAFQAAKWVGGPAGLLAVIATAALTL